MYKTQNLSNTRIDVADALRGIAVELFCLLTGYWYAFEGVRRVSNHPRGPLEGLWRKLTWI